MIFALIISLVTVLLLRPHLARLLEELCRSRARAGFWVVYSSLSICLPGLLTGTARYGYGEAGSPSLQDLFFGLVTQFRGCLVGLLVSLLLVALTADSLLSGLMAVWSSQPGVYAVATHSLMSLSLAILNGLAIVRWAMTGTLVGLTCIAVVVLAFTARSV